MFWNPRNSNTWKVYSRKLEWDKIITFVVSEFLFKKSKEWFEIIDKEADGIKNRLENWDGKSCVEIIIQWMYAHFAYSERRETYYIVLTLKNSLDPNNFLDSYIRPEDPLKWTKNSQIISFNN